MAISQAEELIQTNCRQIYPPNNDFTDSYSESSYLIPTLTAPMWQTKCRQIYPSDSSCSRPSRMAISQIPTLRAHLLWQVMCGRRKCRQIYPPLEWLILQIATLRAHIWFLLWQLICGRPSVGRSTPTRMAISQIATLRAHLLWQIICGRPIIGRSSLQNNDFTNSYSESSYLIPTLDSSYVADQV